MKVLFPRVHVNKATLYKVAGGGVALFVAVNVVVGLVYAERTYPAAKVGARQLGSVPYAQLPARLDALGLLPRSAHLKVQDRSVELEVAQMGIALDRTKTIQWLKEHRSPLPLMNLFTRTNAPVALRQETPQWEKALATAAQTLELAPANAAIIRQDGTFHLKAAIAGRQINRPAAKTRVVETLGRGQTTIELPMTTIAPAVSDQVLQPQIEALQKQQQTTITYRYEGKTKKPTPQEIATWYEQAADGSFVLSDKLIAAYVANVGGGFGITVDNSAAAVAATKSGVQNIKPAEVVLVASIARRTITYCTALRGVDASHLPGLQAKLAATYRDPRGWALGGLVAFREVAAGCEMRVWLSAAAQMPSFGAICDSQWSCAVSPNVVINFDRWQNASDAWNRSRGSLDDYRSMVINHETGHWFGFHHLNCPAAGQAAPVMQQQSIDLQGCSFNPWPLASEQAALRRSLGI